MPHCWKSHYTAQTCRSTFSIYSAQSENRYNSGIVPAHCENPYFVECQKRSPNHKCHERNGTCKLTVAASNLIKNMLLFCFSFDVASDVSVNLCNVKSCLNTSNNEIFTDKRGDLPCVNISKHTCPVVK